jgi:hypothetical protein
MNNFPGAALTVMKIGHLNYHIQPIRVLIKIDNMRMKLGYGCIGGFYPVKVFSKALIFPVLLNFSMSF